MSRRELLTSGQAKIMEEMSVAKAKAVKRGFEGLSFACSPVVIEILGSLVEAGAVLETPIDEHDEWSWGWLLMSYGKPLPEYLA